MLRSLTIHQSDLAKDFPDLSERVSLTDVVSNPVKEIRGDLLNRGGFLLVVAGVGDAASVRERVMHSQLLLELLNFVLVASNKEVGI